MNPPENPARFLTRRHFFHDCGVGLGKIALAGLLTDAFRHRTFAAAASPRTHPLAPRPAHFRATAKRVIHLFMAGAPSQLELFDHKPKLTELEGKPIPPSVIGGQRYAFIRPDAAVLGPRYKFARHGKSGAELSEMLPHLAKVADDICVVRSVRTDQFNHAPAQIFLNTGFSQPGRPSLGSWVLYGLGSETQDLPAFVVMSTGGGISGGSANWASGFLPSLYTGVRFRNQGDPILNVSSPAGIDARLQRDSLDLVRDLNQQRLALEGDPEIATRIAAYEMAFRLQTTAPELMDLKSESKATLDLYGCDPAKPSFARACLLARRMIERGVRFVNIYHEGWDAHGDVAGNVKNNCGKTDQASAALLTDLKQRGLLDDTLVIWGGEFGRTPMVETNPALGRSNGRDHHPQAFSMWLAGGGIKPGLTYGATDDLGFHVVENPVHVHDLQATILHCLGFDHEKLTHHHAGRDFRLTDVHGHVVKDILA
ncbi:sulfatase [Verrucomicrobiota bacterium]|nr:sulfatase [Verrucomicrobiota bacterium]